MTIWSDRVPVAHPTKFPTRAARNTRPVAVVDQLYGGSVRISEIVLKETIPAVQPKAKINPAYDESVLCATLGLRASLTMITFGNDSRKNGRRKYCQYVVVSSG